MWKFVLFVTAASCGFVSAQQSNPSSGNELVSLVLDNCVTLDCVRSNVLGYLDNILNIKGDSARNSKNLDIAIFKRLARVAKTHEFRFKLPEMIFDQTELVYNPRSGLDVAVVETESRGLLKKKLLFPIILLLKLTMKALMPILVALVGLKSLKALILSKLAITIVLGFIIYQLCTKAGMPMPMSMSMAPPEHPSNLYGPPSTSAPPNSYEPSWEPNQGGPYSRIWTPSSDAQPIAYSAYYPGASSSSTLRP